MDVRTKMHKLMQETLADEQKHHDWIYRAIRPMQVPAHWAPGQRIIGDCSKGCQYLAFWADGPDPMGMNFGPYGNSSSICHHLHHLDDPRSLLVGDFVTFGLGGNHHAACVFESDPTHGNPHLWSFGHQGAPNLYTLNWDKRPAQYLRNPVPHYTPTPQDKLRKQTGYFSWVAWKLGEGDWAAYGQGNSHIRPDVPKLIPAEWWKRYSLFLYNRNKGNKPSV